MIKATWRGTSPLATDWKQGETSWKYWTHGLQDWSEQCKEGQWGLFFSSPGTWVLQQELRPNSPHVCLPHPRDWRGKWKADVAPLAFSASNWAFGIVGNYPKLFLLQSTFPNRWCTLIGERLLGLLGGKFYQIQSEQVIASRTLCIRAGVWGPNCTGKPNLEFEVVSPTWKNQAGHRQTRLLPVAQRVNYVQLRDDHFGSPEHMRVSCYLKF